MDRHLTISAWAARIPLTRLQQNRMQPIVSEEWGNVRFKQRTAVSDRT